MCTRRVVSTAASSTCGSRLVASVQILPTLPEAKQVTNVQFLLGDATEGYDWSDATMWFANSTCFDEELMRKLAVVAGGFLRTPMCV